MGAKRERYTPNDVGPSPLEWSAPRLSEVSTLITNGFVGTATPFYTDSTGIPYLYGTNVRANKLELDDVRYITKEFHEAQSKTALKSGDLLTVQSGHIGETAVVTSQLDGSNCHALIVTRLKKEKAYPEFLSYYINSEIGRARMKGLEVGSTILHINTKDLKKFRVLLPSIPEQKKIAQILSTWDKAITTTEQLLANSQQQKKALMQQLLTGKKRLLDKNGVRFSGEWKKVRLGTVADMNSGGTPKSNIEEYYGGNIPWVSIADMTKQGKWIASTEKYLTELGLENSSARIYPKDSVLYAMYASIGECSIAQVPLSSSQAILGIRPKSELNFEFLYFFLNSLKEKIKLQGQQGTQSNLNAGMVKDFLLYLPGMEEQKKIAAVLSTADQEISTLQQKLDALKQEKKALMQQLLTGKRRVLVS